MGRQGKMEEVYPNSIEDAERSARPGERFLMPDNGKCVLRRLRQ